MTNELGLVEVEGVTKKFRQLQSRDGKFGSVRNFFKPVYKDVEALSDVSFVIEPGDRVALLGQNGAGKSTMVKILCGALTPTSGSVRFGGRAISQYSNDIKKRLGIVFGQRSQLWWEIPVNDSLKALKAIYDVTDKTYKEMISIFDEMTGMGHLRRTPVRCLSLGQRTLCEILASCIHCPNVLILDEPTIGLDLSVKENVRSMINEINTRFKTTVVLTSHDTSDIENICDRIILVNYGKIIFDNNVDSFMNEHGSSYTVSLTSRSIIDSSLIINIIGENGILKHIERPANVNELEITFDKKKISPMVMMEKVRNLYEIDEFHIRSSSLESAIKYAYKKNTVV